MHGRRMWQKIFLGVVILLAVVLIGVAGTFFILRFKGKYELKAEKHYITYNEKEYRYRSEIVNILCLGIDKAIPLDETEEGRDNIGMSDVILLLSLDTQRDEAKIIAIHRDSLAELQTLTEDGEPGPREKSRICRQYAAGRTPEESNQLTMDAVSRLLYNIPIQRCCAINGNVVPALNDAIGGVDVVIQEDLGDWEPRFVYGEEIHLEGELAYRFIDVRNKSRIDGALLRTQRQKQYVRAFADKAKKVISSEPSVVFTLLKEFQNLQENRDICTDITTADIIYLLPEVLQISFSDDMIEVLPGESVEGEDGRVDYLLDTDAVTQIVIDTFYEEVSGQQ